MLVKLASNGLYSAYVGIFVSLSPSDVDTREIGAHYSRAGVSAMAFKCAEVV